MQTQLGNKPCSFEKGRCPKSSHSCYAVPQNICTDLHCLERYSMHAHILHHVMMCTHIYESVFFWSNLHVSIFCLSLSYPHSVTANPLYHWAVFFFCPQHHKYPPAIWQAGGARSRRPLSDWYQSPFLNHVSVPSPHLCICIPFANCSCVCIKAPFLHTYSFVVCQHQGGPLSHI